MSLRTVREQTGDLDGMQALACTVCGARASYEALSFLGARCSRCFDRYLRDPQPAPNVPAAGGVVVDRLAWARLLRDREAAGQRLSRVQRDAWRAALGPADLAGEVIFDVTA
ncbi:MAG TPA: hypothetical protein PKD87_15335 [Burkholderiaceae bacterium]|nr:hypothetical protein [Burkholderiaceae bacterium]